jgi:hypothetical protein
VFANHADAESKTYRVLYSTDGEQFLPLGETPSPGSARIEVKGRALLPRPGRKIWLSYVLPARSIGIVLKQAAVELILGGGAPGND